MPPERILPNVIFKAVCLHDSASATLHKLSILGITEPLVRQHLALPYRSLAGCRKDGGIIAHLNQPQFDELGQMVFIDQQASLGIYIFQCPS